MKKILTLLLLALTLPLNSYAAQPYSSFHNTLLPIIDSFYDIGTSTRAWKTGYFDELCLTADSCKTAWPTGGGGGSGNVSTSSSETATYIPYWDTTSATPALLSGGESTFTYNATENRLTIQRASSTDLTVTGTASTSALRASTSFTFKDVTGFLYATAGAVATKAIDLASDITGVLPLANGGTNASSITATQLLWNNGTRIAGTSTPTASYFIATSTDATSTLPLLSVQTGINLFGTFANELSDLCVAITGGSGLCDGTDNTGGGGGEWPFTQDSYAGVAVQSTTTPLLLKATSPFSLIATSTFVTQASSTQLTNSGNTWLPTLTSALIQTDAAGLLAEYAGTSCTNQFVRSLSALGIATCASVSLTADVTGTLSIANGGTNATAYSSQNPIAFDGTRLVASSTPTASYFIATSTAHRSVFPYASTTALTVSGNSYLGTVSSGTWNGTTIAIANGGTNATAYSVQNPLYFDGTRFSATSTPTASYFIATSTAHRSVLPYASTTALTISGSGNSLNVSSASATSTFAGGATLATGGSAVGIGTSTPTALLQLFTSASTTLSVDSNSSSKGACLQLKDLDGSGYTYVYANNGVIYSSTISCK